MDEIFVAELKGIPLNLGQYSPIPLLGSLRPPIECKVHTLLLECR
jgi:hypothetical protein